MTRRMIRLPSRLHDSTITHAHDWVRDGKHHERTLFGYFVSNGPFVHEDSGLVSCTLVAIRDLEAGVYAGGHVNFQSGCNPSDLRLDLAALDGILGAYGSVQDNREVGLVFGHAKSFADHDGVEEALRDAGYRVGEPYQSGSFQDHFSIDHYAGTASVTPGGESLKYIQIFPV